MSCYIILCDVLCVQQTFEEVGDVVNASRVGQAAQAQRGTVGADDGLHRRAVTVGRGEWVQLPGRGRQRGRVRQRRRARHVLLAVAQVVLPLLHGLQITTSQWSPYACCVRLPEKLPWRHCSQYVNSRAGSFLHSGGVTTCPSKCSHSCGPFNSIEVAIARIM